MRTPKQIATAIENLKKVKRRGGSSNAAWLEAGKRNFEKGRKLAPRGLSRERMEALGLLDPETNRRRRYAQLAHEQEMATDLAADGYEVYSPTVVCDRIAIKDGKVFFVEFKKPGQKLRPGQQRVRDLVPDRYLIRYGEVTESK